MTTTQTQLTSVSAAAAASSVSIGHWLHQGNTHVSETMCGVSWCLGTNTGHTRLQ